MKLSTLRRLNGTKVLGIFLLLVALPASAEEVGTVAAVEGTAEIGREGIWTPAANGTAVAVGDELRTGSPGHLRVVFQDDTLLTLSADSHVTVDRQVFDPTAGQRQSLLGLLQGKVAAVVSEYYRGAGTRYEIKDRNRSCRRAWHGVHGQLRPEHQSDRGRWNQWGRLGAQRG